MDFDLDEDQRALLDAVESLLTRHAGATRALELQGKGELDRELAAALEQAGFTGIAGADGMGPLAAELVVEAIARAGGLVSAGADLLVAPALGLADAEAPIALATRSGAGPVRFGAQARTLLLVGDDEAHVVALAPGSALPVPSMYGYPLGRIDLPAASGRSLGPGSAARALAWWRVALAAECVGSMDGALARTTAYLAERRQFGRPIASFQAVQHRLAECAVALEACRWLTREAAHRQAPAEAAATAAAYASEAAQRLFAETHQLSGAIGYTHEHGLHVFSMRLQALRLELGGVGAHRRAAARARWIGQD